MPATTIGQTGLLFGVPNAEVGVIIASIERASQRQKKEVLNNVGDIIAAGYFAPKAVYTCAGALQLPSGYTTNTAMTGLAASAYPGGVVTLANILNDPSTTGGHVYADEFTIRESNEDFVKFTATFTQYPSITTP